MKGLTAWREKLLAASAAVALTLAVLGVAPGALAAQRMVLAENFTATW